MRHLLIELLEYWPFQLTVCAVMAGLTNLAIYYGDSTGVDLSSLDRPTLIAALSAVSTLIALFCSLSIAWILFVSQQSTQLRLSAYDLLKSRLPEVQRWLLESPPSARRELCLAVVYSLHDLHLCQLPDHTLVPELGDYYEARDRWMEAAGSRTDTNEEDRVFWLLSSSHFAYIDSLLDRVALVSRRKEISRQFVSTLAKGLALVAIAILILLTSMLSYTEAIKPTLVVGTTFVAVGSVLLLAEVWIDLRDYYDDDFDFINDPAEA